MRALTYHGNHDVRVETVLKTLKLEEAADGYRMFDRKEQECRKVILYP